MNAISPRPAPRLREATVLAAEAISPRMRRVTLTGPDFADFVTASPDDHVKLLFPAAQPGGPPAARDYTPRRFDPLRRELVLDFVLHGHGPAATWAASARAGDPITVAGPRGSRPFPDAFDALLLAGDETALPAISRALEESAPGAPVLALIEVADAAEERHLPTAANAQITWLHRDGAGPGDPSLLGAAIRRLRLPPGQVHAWIAAEIETARMLRRHLVDDEAIPRDRIHAAGYWRLGEPGAHARIRD